MKLTIFTVDLFDNDYLNEPLHKLCINSWDNLVTYLNTKGIETTLKIFNSKSPEVIAYCNECQTYMNSGESKSHKANGFRMYMLKQNPNWLWLDCDVYCYSPEQFYEDFDFNKRFFRTTWWCLYNHTDLNFFNNIYITYPIYLLPHQGDKKVSASLNLGTFSERKGPKGLAHLYYVDNYGSNSIIHYYKNIENVPSEYVTYNSDLKSDIFIIEVEYNQSGLKSLYGDKTLINFINSQFKNRIKYED